MRKLSSIYFVFLLICLMLHLYGQKDSSINMHSSCFVGGGLNKYEVSKERYQRGDRIPISSYKFNADYYLNFGYTFFLKNLYYLSVGFEFNDFDRKYTQPTRSRLIKIIDSSQYNKIVEEREGSSYEEYLKIKSLGILISVGKCFIMNNKFSFLIKIKGSLLVDYKNNIWYTETTAITRNVYDSNYVLLDANKMILSDKRTGQILYNSHKQFNLSDFSNVNIKAGFQYKINKNIGFNMFFHVGTSRYLLLFSHPYHKLFYGISMELSYFFEKKKN
ncbi:MAG: hypothetical protein KatS3mg027_1258 [Bacteroidia bacterium]|nr:MAG: hypothetical protein KatS3mg027_1258 [Bacteroidia bacterium]